MGCLPTQNIHPPPFRHFDCLTLPGLPTHGAFNLALPRWNLAVPGRDSDPRLGVSGGLPCAEGDDHPIPCVHPVISTLRFLNDRIPSRRMTPAFHANYGQDLVFQGHLHSPQPDLTSRVSFLVWQPHRGLAILAVGYGAPWIGCSPSSAQPGFGTLPTPDLSHAIGYMSKWR